MANTKSQDESLRKTAWDDLENALVWGLYRHRENGHAYSIRKVEIYFGFLQGETHDLTENVSGIAFLLKDLRDFILESPENLTETEQENYRQLPEFQETREAIERQGFNLK